MYNYNFYISDSPNKNGKYSIKLRYYENRHARVQIDTGIEVPLRFWNKEKSFLKKSREVISEHVQISLKDNLAQQIVTTYKNQSKPLSKKLFKTQFQDGRPTVNHTPLQEFFIEFDNYLQERQGCQ